MALDLQLEALMIHRVIVDHFTGLSTDGYGVRTYDTSSTFKARIEFKSRITKDKDMKDAVSTTTIFTPPYDTAGSTAAVIGLSDRVTLPTQFFPRKPPIINVEPHYDHEGPHHIEVYL